MSRNAADLKSAIKEINELKSDFYSNVFVPGESENFNEELAKAGRVADFLELGELLQQMPWLEMSLVEGHFQRRISNARRVKH